MRVALDFASLNRSRWYELLARFVLGGAITAAAGLIARHYGPVPAGLFLAFPAIFPASATLIEKHETQKKKEAGIDCRIRGRKAAGLDAAGAVLGSLALAVFALIVWKWLPRGGAILVLGAAALGWAAVATGLWWMRKKHFLNRQS